MSVKAVVSEVKTGIRRDLMRRLGIRTSLVHAVAGSFHETVIA